MSVRMCVCVCVCVHVRACEPVRWHVCETAERPRHSESQILITPSSRYAIFHLTAVQHACLGVLVRACVHVCLPIAVSVYA